MPDEGQRTQSQETINKAISELNRMALLLAVVVLAAAIAGFFIIAMTLHEVIWRAMFLGVMSNIIASVLIYLALYFSLARVSDLRRGVWRQELIRDISTTIATSPALTVQVLEAVPGKPDNKLIGHNHLAPERRDIIQRFLEATYRLVAALTKNPDIRLYCHIADERERLLYPVSIASIHINDDYKIAIPFEGPRSDYFIIAKAMKTEAIAAENLPSNHMELYPPDLRPKILSTLKCVIALPIMAYDPGDEDTAVPIGTVSIDCSSATLVELGMVDSEGIVVDEINDILKSCARVVHRVLTFT